MPDAFIEMAVSFDYKYLAMFGSNGRLWVGLSNLQVFNIVKIYVVMLC
jgi:hypothetical protein